MKNILPSILPPEIEAQMTIHTILCPICKEYHSALKTDKLAICGSCRWEINHCNENNKETCFDCVNLTHHADINDLDNVKTTRRYGCWKGSRLVKAAKKLKMSQLGVKRYLRWKVV